MVFPVWIREPGEPTKKVSFGVDHTCAHLVDDTIKCWGSSYNGQGGRDTSSNMGDGANEMGDYAVVVVVVVVAAVVAVLLLTTTSNGNNNNNSS